MELILSMGTLIIELRSVGLGSQCFHPLSYFLGLRVILKLKVFFILYYPKMCYKPCLDQY